MVDEKNISEELERLVKLLVCGLMLMLIGVLLVSSCYVFVGHPFLLVLVDTFLSFFIGMIFSVLRRKC